MPPEAKEALTEPSAAPGDAGASRWSDVPPAAWLAAGLLLALACLLPTLGFGFVYDDHWTIAANGFLRYPGDLPRLLDGGAAARNVPDAFRPTLVAFDVASYQAFGLSARAHHALSLALHLGTAWLLARWLGGLGAPSAIRIGTASVFAALAIHAEAIAVISFREDLLAASLGLGALVLANAAIEAETARGRGIRSVTAAVLLALAVGAKASAAPLVAVFVLARWLAPWERGLDRRAWVPTLALTLGVAVAVGHRVALYDGLSPFVPDDPRLLLPKVGLAATLAASVQNHLDVLWRCVVPLSLSPEYVDAARSWGSPATWLAALALLAIAAWGGLCAVRWRRPGAALAVGATLLLALPTSGLVAMPNLRADRFAYLPSLGVCLGLTLAAHALGRWVASRRGRDAAVGSVVAVAAVIVVQAAFLQAAIRTYRSDTRLWSVALRRAPHSARAHAVMGELLMLRAGRQEQPDARLLARARAHCKIARLRAPGMPLTALCEARLAALDRDWERAYRRFADAEAIAVQGRDRVLAGLASVALDRPGVEYAARVEEATATLDDAMREYPYSSEVFAVAARIHHRLGHGDRALELYSRASSLRPERWDLVVQRLELALDLGDASAARTAWVRHERGVLQALDPAQRARLRRRLHDAERLFGTLDHDP